MRNAIGAGDLEEAMEMGGWFAGPAAGALCGLEGLVPRPPRRYLIEVARRGGPRGAGWNPPDEARGGEGGRGRRGGGGGGLGGGGLGGGHLSEREGAGLSEQLDESAEQLRLRGREGGHVRLAAVRLRRSEEGDLPLPVLDDLLPLLHDLPELVLEQHRLRGVRPLRDFLRRLRLEVPDICGELPVEVRLQAGEALLRAFLPVDLRNAVEINELVGHRGCHRARGI